MTVYLGLYFLLALLCFVTRNTHQEKLLVVVVCSLLVIFVGARFETGCDFQSYYLRFSSLRETDSFFDIIFREEPGFWVISYIVKALGLSYVWVNLIGAVIFFYCTARFVLRHPNSMLLLTIMFPILIVQLSMSGLRQALAVAFFMLAILAHFDLKRAHVVVFILIGSIFHQSLILFLPLAFTVGREFSVSRVLLALAALMPVALIVSVDRIGVYNNRYIEQLYGQMESSGAVFRLGLLLLSALVFEFYKDKMRAMFPREYNLMRIFSLFSFALIPVAFVSTVIVHRLGFYVLPVQLFTLSLIPYVAFTSFRSVNIGQIFPIGVYAAYIGVWFLFSFHAKSCYTPYDSYLF